MFEKSRFRKKRPEIGSFFAFFWYHRHIYGLNRDLGFKLTEHHHWGAKHPPYAFQSDWSHTMAVVASYRCKKRLKTGCFGCGKGLRQSLRLFVGRTDQQGQNCVSCTMNRCMNGQRALVDFFDSLFSNSRAKWMIF